MRLYNKLELTQKMKTEPEVQDKIRVRHIELVDEEDNVVASIGQKAGIYEEGKKPIFQIFNELQQVEVEISNKGITIHQHDDGILSSKSIKILNHTQFGGGIRISSGWMSDSICIFDKKGDDIIELRAHSIFSNGYISIRNVRTGTISVHKIDGTSVSLTADSGTGILEVSDNEEQPVQFRVNGENDVVSLALNRIPKEESDGKSDKSNKDKETEAAVQERILAIYQNSLYTALVEVTAEVETVEELEQLSEDFNARMVKFAKQKSIEEIERDPELMQSDFGQAFLHVLRNPSPREDDIDLEYLDLDWDIDTELDTTSPVSPTPENNEQSNEDRVYNSIEKPSSHIDDIVRKAQMPVQKVSGILLSLEMKGLVERHPGNMYSIAQ